MLKLTRPLCILDLETTGTSPDKDKIVQICIIKINPDGTRVVKTRYVNPEIPIPESATAVHKITDLMVKEEPTFLRIAYNLYEFIKGCDIAAYNGNTFDVPMLYNEFYRVGIIWDLQDIAIVDAMNIFKIKETRTLEAAVEFYCFGQKHVNSHDAEKDADATYNVLLGQIDTYEELQSMDMEQLSKFSNYGRQRADVHNKFYIDDNGDYVINFGQQHKGKLAKTELGFIEWMMNPDKNFSPDTRRHCEIILKKYSTQNT